MDGAKYEPYGSTWIENREKIFTFLGKQTLEASRANFPVVFTENPIQVDDVMESPKLAE